MTDLRPGTTLRWLLLGAMVTVLVQAGVGMAVNLYVVVPVRHPGAHPATYLGGSFRSVVWALAHGAPALVAHAARGLVLVVLVVGVGLYAFRARPRAVWWWSVLGGLLVIGAGFNGASFLDFEGSSSSLLMSLLAFGAVACYAVALVLAGRPLATVPDVSVPVVSVRAERRAAERPRGGP